MMGTRTPLARRGIAAALMVLLTACQTWQPTIVSPQQLISEERPSRVRATLTRGETITVRDPTIRNDSIVSATDADVAGVATRDVSLLEVRHFNIGAAVFFTAFFGALVAVFIDFANSFDDIGLCPQGCP